MQLFYITLLFVLHNTFGETSILNVTQEGITSFEDFPQVVYPKSVLDTVPFNLKPSGVLEPFTEDVKTNFKAIENSRNSKKATTSTLIDILAPVSNKDGSITNINNDDVEYVPFEENTGAVHNEEYLNVEGADESSIIVSQQLEEAPNVTESESNHIKPKDDKNDFVIDGNDLSDITLTQNVVSQNSTNENQETNMHNLNQEINIDSLEAEQQTNNGNLNDDANNDVADFAYIENSTNEDVVTQIEGSLVKNETEDLNRKKRSPNTSSESAYFENVFDEEYVNGEVVNNTSERHTKATTARIFTSSEAVLPRPPLATEDDDGIIIEDHDETNEDSFSAQDCVENCIVDKTRVNVEDRNEDF